MKFRNARFKLRESKYFLNRVHECYNNELITNYYTNAFISSSRSVIDYVRQDFFDELNFKISNKEYSSRRKFKKILEKTEQDKRKKIEDFLSNHEKKYCKFLQNPLNYYFNQRRNTIIHHSGNRMGVYSLTQMTKDKKIVNVRRFLESPDSIEIVMQNPSKWIDFGQKLSYDDRHEYEYMLRFQDTYFLLKKFFSEVTDFLKSYEKDFSSFSWLNRTKDKKRLN